MVEEAPSRPQRYSMNLRTTSITASTRANKRATVSMARAYKLAQYFRVLPCLYAEQVFCYAACLLKWFRLEAMRQEAFAASVSKGQHGVGHAGTPTANLDPTIRKSSSDPVETARIMDSEDDEEEEIEPTMTESHNLAAEVVETQEDEKEESENPVLDADSPEASQKHSGSGGSPSVHEGSSRSEESKVIGQERPVYGNPSKSVLTRITYANARERRDTYRLAFNTMKYVTILEKLLDEIAFFLEYPDLKEEEYLVLVLVYDYTTRNFQRRVPLPHERSLPTLERYFEYLNNNRLVLYPPGTELFTAAESAVQAMCMRLAAAVARVRVRQQVGSLRLLLPEEWRTSEQMAELMPSYAWYNQLLGKQEVVNTWLKDNGYRRIMAGRVPQPMEYASDKHCSDVFIFNKADVSNLLDSDIVQQKNLVFQDKSSCLAIHCCLANVAGGEELMFVNCPNVFSAVHMEGLIGNKFPLIQPVPQIRCVRSVRDEEDARLSTKMGSKSIKTSTEEFLSVEPNNEKNRTIRHIFIEASDTRSGVVNPVGFLEVEADDLNILRDMWTPAGNQSKENHRAELIAKTSALLKHALKFVGIRTVTLLSHSQDADETDALVAKVLDTTNRLLLREAELIAATSRNVNTGIVFNPQIPTFPGLQEERDAYEAGKVSIVTKSKSIRVPPSQESNGFYVVILHKEQFLLKHPEDQKQEAEQTGKTAKEPRSKGRAKKR